MLPKKEKKNQQNEEQAVQSSPSLSCSIEFALHPPIYSEASFCHIVHFRGGSNVTTISSPGSFNHFAYDNTRDIKMINDRIRKKNTQRWMRSNPNQGDSINHPAGGHAVEPREVVRQNHQMSLFLRRSGRAGHAHRTSFALVGGSGVLFGVSPLDLTGR